MLGRASKLRQREAAASHAAPDHAHVHVTPLWVYLAVFAALLLFTGLTVAVAFVHLGALNDVVAMAIAIFKATLVVLFFMHVKGSTRMIKLTVVSSFFWLLILFGLTLSDYFTRSFLN
jgi:cytochrome c oxidase subunit 4